MPDHATRTVPQRGQRIRLISLGPLPDGAQHVSSDGVGPGSEGTVLFTDSQGTVHTEWDGGISWGLTPGSDTWQILAGGQADPSDDLREAVQQTITDLAEVPAQLMPGSPEEAESTARIMDRLAEECAESAAMIRALPGRPREAPGYTLAATAAVTTAARAEHDFGRWLAVILCQAAAHLGSPAALTLGRPGGWEAGHVLALVRDTAGHQDQAPCCTGPSPLSGPAWSSRTPPQRRWSRS